MRIATYIIICLSVIVAVIWLINDYYTKQPIVTKAILSNTVVEQGQDIMVSVVAKNRYFNKPIVVPRYHRFKRPSFDMGGVGFYFKPDGSDYHPNIAYSGSSISEPAWDRIEPRDIRHYEFYWSPNEASIGDGTLFVTLPKEFVPVGPFKVKVIPKTQSEQAAPSNR